MWQQLRAEVESRPPGLHVVCPPAVEDKGSVEAKAATVEFERLQAEELAGLAASACSTASCPRGEGSR